MVKKLTSFLKSRIEWRLSLEAAVAAVLLFFAASPISPIGLIGLIGLIVWLFRLYLLHRPQIKSFQISFWLLPLLALLAIGLIGPIGPIGLISLVFGIFLYLLLGFSNFLFKNNVAVYGFFNTALLLFLFLIFLGSSIGPIGLIRPIGLIVIVTLLFREFFSNPIRPIGPISQIGPRRTLTVSAVLSFIALELAWLLSFLPLGFVNAAVFLTLFLILSRDVLLSYFQGNLRLPFIFRQLTFFVIISIIIFAASQWGL